MELERKEQQKEKEKTNVPMKIRTPVTFIIIICYCCSYSTFLSLSIISSFFSLFLKDKRNRNQINLDEGVQEDRPVFDDLMTSLKNQPRVKMGKRVTTSYLDRGSFPFPKK